MNLKENDWKFDKSVVDVFDEHVIQSVPMYNEFHQNVTELAAWFLTENSNVYDIGTSTGKLLKSLQSKYDKKVNYIGLDNSKDMIETLKDSSFELINVNLNNEFKFKNASFITSILTLQFLKPKNRQLIIDNIYEGLDKSGAFVLIEKIIPCNSEFNEIYNGIYYDFKLNNGLTKNHIIEKSKSIRGVMSPLTLEENIEMLKNSGFSKIDIFFKWNNFAGLLAIK